LPGTYVVEVTAYERTGSVICPPGQAVGAPEHARVSSLLSGGGRTHGQMEMVLQIGKCTVEGTRQRFLVVGSKLR
jgi:hypothetical protein